MIDTFLLDPVRDMPLRGWMFLLLLTLVVVAVNCRAFPINKNRVLLSILILYIGAILCMTVIGRNVEDKMMYRIIPLWSWKKALTNIVHLHYLALVTLLKKQLHQVCGSDRINRLHSPQAHSAV